MTIDAQTPKSVMLFVPGQARQDDRKPRGNGYGKYHPKPQQLYRQRLADVAAQAMRDAGHSTLLAGPLSLEILVCRAYTQTALQPCTDANPYRWAATAAPDTTNYVKLVEDAIQGIVFKNDAAIIHQNNSKIFGETDQLVVRITEVPSSPMLYKLCPLVNAPEVLETMPLRINEVHMAHDGENYCWSFLQPLVVNLVNDRDHFAFVNAETGESIGAWPFPAGGWLSPRMYPDMHHQPKRRQMELFVARKLTMDVTASFVPYLKKAHVPHDEMPEEIRAARDWWVSHLKLPKALLKKLGVTVT